MWLAWTLRASTEMITTVLFDMNDVLFRYVRSARVADLARVSGKPAAEVESAIWGSGFEDFGDTGGIDADAYLAGFGERLGWPLTPDAWAEALRAAVAPMPETLALAAAVRRKARVAVLTNNNLLVKRMVDAVFPELRPIFGEDFYVSAEFGARKPEPAVYLACLSRLDAEPNVALFVDDSARNVAGAALAGLETHLFRSPPELEQALKREALL